MCVDLHTHSIYSDGTATPQEIVQLAADLHLHGLAITDHDTIDGYAEALAAGRRAGVPILSGLEISCVHGADSLHILGYGIQPDNQALQTMLHRLQAGRIQRNHKILAKLDDLGIQISEQELREHSVCGQTGRPHIARLLVKKKIVSGMEQAFRHYLGKGKSAYAGRFCFSAAETISCIHEAGGVAVLAHPGILDPAMRKQPRLIAELVERQLDGLEIFYPTHSGSTQKKLHQLADRYNLLKTGGSDYHGSNRKNNGLAGHSHNLCPPDTIMDNLQLRLQNT